MTQHFFKYASIILLSAFLLPACKSSTFSKKKSKQNTSVTQGSSSMSGTYAQGIDAGTIFSDRSKCQITPDTAGTEQHYFFEFNESRLSSQARASIEKQANYLLKYPNKRIKLEGNTDDRGSREYNIALGWRRTRAVAQALTQYGVSKNQMALVSFGAERPVAFGKTETARHCNRRVDLTY